MWKNYLKIAFRQLKNQKTFSFINVFGLAVSMSVCMLIIMLIKDAHSYDLFHTDGDQIYRVNTTPVRKSGSTESYASSPFPVGKSLAEDCPQVSSWTPLISGFSGQIASNDHKISFNGLFTDASFFEMFGFKLREGNTVKSLEEPYSVILTEQLAQKLFKNEQPVGKEIKISDYDTPFKVSGVLEAFPGKTHLEFEALASLATKLALEKSGTGRSVTGVWQNYYSSYNFVRLHKSANKATAELALAEIAKANYRDLEFESRDLGYKFTLQPLAEITPGPILSNSMGQGMPKFLIWFLTVLALVIILSACFNYTNLTIARSFIRTKEIGVRKVVGATRGQVFWQFINEAVVTALLAFGIGYLLLIGLKPLFLQLKFNQFTDITLVEDWILITMFLLFVLAVGFVAGFLPAITLSRTSPKSVLQHLQNIKLIKWLGFRKILLVVQFFVTLVFFITVTIAWQQINYATKMNFGFDRPKTLVVDIQDQEFTKILASFSKVSGVEEISAISFPMGTWQDASSDVRIDMQDEKTGVRDYFIDENYLNHFDLEMVAGKSFSQNLSQQNEAFAIVNETFVEKFELGDPLAAVGRPLIIGDSTQLTIQGVVKDFLFKPSNYAIEPLLLRYDPAQFGTLNLSLSGTDVPATLTALERNWKALSDLPLEAEFFDEIVKENYSNLTDILWIVGFFGLISMIIACMGLLGMAIYLVQTKAKEISIRKILGAGLQDLVLSLSKNYLILFGIAILVATPVSYLLGAQILQIFANRISISPGVFLPGILLLLFIVLLTIGSQTVKASLANPVKSLRNE